MWEGWWRGRVRCVGGDTRALSSPLPLTHTHTAHSATHARARAGSHPEAAGASVVRACVCVSGWVGLNARRGERLAERNRECRAIFSLSLLTLQFPAVPLAGSPAAHAPAPPSRLPPGFPAPSGRPADRQRRPQPRRQSLERSGTDDDTPNGARSPLPPLPPGRPGGRRPAPGRPGPAGGGAGVWWAGRGGPGPGRPGGARPGVGGRRTQRARRARRGLVADGRQAGRGLSAPRRRRGAGRLGGFPRERAAARSGRLHAGPAL